MSRLDIVALVTVIPQDAGIADDRRLDVCQLAGNLLQIGDERLKPGFDLGQCLLEFVLVRAVK
jgi:hypothetical protein